MLTAVLVALAHAWTLGPVHAVAFVVGSALVGIGLVVPLLGAGNTVCATPPGCNRTSPARSRPFSQSS